MHHKFVAEGKLVKGYSCYDCDFNPARDTIPLSMNLTVWTAVEAVRAAGGPWVGTAAHSLTLGQQAARDTIPFSMKYVPCGQQWRRSEQQVAPG